MRRGALADYAFTVIQCENRHCATGCGKKRNGQLAVPYGCFYESLSSETICCICAHLASMSVTILNWVRQRSKFCPFR